MEANLQPNPGSESNDKRDRNADSHPGSKTQTGLGSVQSGTTVQFVNILFRWNFVFSNSYSSRMPLKARGDPDPIKVPAPPMLAV